MAKVVAFTSGKGGTGKSTVSAELACTLARYGRSVLIVDMESGLRSLDYLLGLEDRVVFDLGDVFSGKCGLAEALSPHREYPLLKLACLPDGAAPARESLQPVFCAAEEMFDYILLDLPAGIGSTVRMAAEFADLFCLVTLPDRIAARDSRATLEMLRGERELPARLLINRVDAASMRSGGFENLDDLMDFVGAPLLGVIPEDRSIRSAKLVPERRKKRLSATEDIFDAIACRIMGRYVPLILTTV